jgi:GAF domain-containing protein
VDPLEVLHDPARIAALRRLRLLDSSAEDTFDRLARIAKISIGVPVALISLVAEHRQFFTSCLGLAEPWASARETPLSHSFCQYAVATGEELVVEDARVDQVLTTNPAIQDMGVVAYAGVPIRVGAGVAIGTLCVIDSTPRRWTETELELLRDLAGAVGDLLEPRLALLRAPERQAVLAQLV